MHELHLDPMVGNHETGLTAKCRPSCHNLFAPWPKPAAGWRLDTKMRSQFSFQGNTSCCPWTSEDQIEAHQPAPHPAAQAPTLPRTAVCLDARSSRTSSQPGNKQYEQEHAAAEDQEGQESLFGEPPQKVARKKVSSQEPEEVIIEVKGQAIKCLMADKRLRAADLIIELDCN